MNPIAKMNQNTTKILSHPAYEAPMMKIAGGTPPGSHKLIGKYYTKLLFSNKKNVNNAYKPATVKIFRATVIVKYFLLIK